MAETTKPGQAKQATKPGSEPAPAAKKERPALVPYPGLEVKDGKPTKKLEAWPTDFDRKVHLPLKRTDFTNDAEWLERMAAEYKKKADRFLQEAADARKFGNASTRQTAKRLRSMQARVKDMVEQLKAAGIDPESIMASLEQSAAAPEAAK